jgi:hypothetical protein
MAMAMSDSVTVSIGLETMGVFKEIFLVKPGLTAGGDWRCTWRFLRKLV